MKSLSQQIEEALRDAMERLVDANMDIDEADFLQAQSAALDMCAEGINMRLQERNDVIETTPVAENVDARPTV